MQIPHGPATGRLKDDGSLLAGDNIGQRRPCLSNDRERASGPPPTVARQVETTRVTVGQHEVAHLRTRPRRLGDRPAGPELDVPGWATTSQHTLYRPVAGTSFV
jgi:hypothetical protein